MLDRERLDVRLRKSSAGMRNTRRDGPDTRASVGISKGSSTRGLEVVGGNRRDDRPMCGFDSIRWATLQ